MANYEAKLFGDNGQKFEKVTFPSFKPADAAVVQFYRSSEVIQKAALEKILARVGIVNRKEYFEELVQAPGTTPSLSTDVTDEGKPLAQKLAAALCSHHLGTTEYKNDLDEHPLNILLGTAQARIEKGENSAMAHYRDSSFESYFPKARIPGSIQPEIRRNIRQLLKAHGRGLYAHVNAAAKTIISANPAYTDAMFDELKLRLKKHFDPGTKGESMWDRDVKSFILKDGPADSEEKVEPAAAAGRPTSLEPDLGAFGFGTTAKVYDSFMAVGDEYEATPEVMAEHQKIEKSVGIKLAEAALRSLMRSRGVDVNVRDTVVAIFKNVAKDGKPRIKNAQLIDQTLKKNGTTYSELLGLVQQEVDGLGEELDEAFANDPQKYWSIWRNKVVRFVAPRLMPIDAVKVRTEISKSPEKSAFLDTVRYSVE